MLPVTCRCHICHHRAPIVEGRYGSHGGPKGCRASGMPLPRIPAFVFETEVRADATRKTIINVTMPGIKGGLSYEIGGPGHRDRAAQFADALKVPCFTAQEVLTRLHHLEKTTQDLTATFKATLGFCLAVLKRGAHFQ